MVRLRKFVAYRKLERPYTRVSKYKGKSFIKMSPHIKVIGFELGSPKKKFSYNLRLISKDDLQIRENALESAKQTSNKLLETSIGLSSYHLKLRTYPHHVLREPALASGAGADRFSSGMAHSFGKPLGVAARVREGQVLFQVNVDKQNLEIARQALESASKKLPCPCMIQIAERK